MKRAFRLFFLGIFLCISTDAFAETCTASRTVVKDDSAAGFAAEDLPLEKTTIQDGDLLHSQWVLKNSDGMPFFLSAATDTSGNGLTLLVKDNITQVSSGVTGSFGSDGAISTNLGFVIAGKQQVITVVCVKDIPPGATSPANSHKPDLKAPPASKTEDVANIQVDTKVLKAPTPLSLPTTATEVPTPSATANPSAKDATTPSPP